MKDIVIDTANAVKKLKPSTFFQKHAKTHWCYKMQPYLFNTSWKVKC